MSTDSDHRWNSCMTDTPPAIAHGEEARMRAAALQVLYLLRTHADHAATEPLWSAVIRLEDTLKSEPWPDDQDTMKSTPIMAAWSGVSRAVRSTQGPEDNRWDVEKVVSGLMGAVSAGRSADRSAAKNASRTAETGQQQSYHFFDARSSRRDASGKLEEACLAAAELGVPTEALESLNALKIPEWSHNWLS